MKLSLSHWHPGSGVVLDCIVPDLFPLRYFRCNPATKQIEHSLVNVYPTGQAQQSYGFYRGEIVSVSMNSVDIALTLLCLFLSVKVPPNYIEHAGDYVGRP